MVVPWFSKSTICLCVWFCPHDCGVERTHWEECWLNDHEKEFEKVKRLLTSSMAVTHFDPSLPVTVLTDASPLYGLGYAMGCMVDSRFWIGTCGSKSLTPTQQRHSTTELEFLAVHFTVSKCASYLKGMSHLQLLRIIGLWRGCSKRTNLKCRIPAYKGFARENRM